MTLFSYVLRHSAKRMAILIPLLAASPLAVQAQVAFSPPQNVSSNPGTSYLSQIAVDSTGSINIVWLDNTPGNYDVFFSRSSDGGATFSTPIALSTRPSGGPQVAVDSAGNINVAWRDGYNNFDVAFSRSSDGGATFTTPQVISYVMEADPELYMALDSHGNIYVVWDTQPYGNIYLSHSSDGGATFTYTTITNNTGPVGPRDAQIAIDSSGNINVVWTFSDIFFSRSSDGGATFSTPQNLSNDLRGFEPQIATDSSGNINVIWPDNTPGNYDIFFTR